MLLVVSVPGAAYLGSAVAALLLLGTAWYGVARRRMPVELCAASLLAAACAVASGYLLDTRWQLAGTLSGGSDGVNLTEAEARRAIVLLTSPTYLAALGLDPRAGDFLREGLSIAAAEDGGVCIRYDFRGFAGSPSAEVRRRAAFFVRETARQLPGVLFAAQLLAARSSDSLAALLSRESVVLLSPSRLLIREIVPELADRFPAAAGLLTDLLRKAGGE
jgi:hypothetical protein